MTHGLKSVARRMACALVVWQLLCTVAMDRARGQAPMTAPGSSPYAGLPVISDGSSYPVAGAPQVVYGQPGMYAQQPTMPMGYPNAEPTSASMIVPSNGPQYVDADVYCQGQPETTYPGGTMIVPASDVWDWQVLPQGLIYRSYWAGVKEPRLGIQLMHISGDRSFWEPMVGARVGIIRYGTMDGLRPQGWEWDIEGAANPRLTLDRDRDLETVDFRGGTYITYGIDKWQFKFGYYHLSSHLGDELAIKDPILLAERINYVRDSLIFGVSYYATPGWRLYGEAANAVNADGGAEPWEFQFGTEWSQPGPTGPNGSPFVALNGHLRQEEDFSGDFTAQTGWMWRNPSGQTLRIGLHYYNGKSSQWETFSHSEQQVGVGAWYDF